MAMRLSATHNISINQMEQICKAAGIAAPKRLPDWGAVIDEELFKTYAIHKSAIWIAIRNNKAISTMDAEFLLAWQIIYSAHINSLCGQHTYEPIWKDLIFA